MTRLSRAAIAISTMAWGIQPANAGILAPSLQEQLQSANADDVIRAIVMLPEQFDRTSFVGEMKAKSKNNHQRHVEAVTRLQQMSSRAQVDLLSFLQDELTAGRAVDVEPLWIANAVIVTATRSTLEAISRRTDVGTLYPDYPISLIAPVDDLEIDTAARPEYDAITGSSGPSIRSIEEGVSSTRAPELWDMGIDGSGVIVGDMDTGADGDHPAFGSRWLGHRKPSAQTWFDPVTSTTVPQEFSWVSHGTHTLGTICGSSGSNEIGMAPGAEWIAAAVIDRVSIERTIADAILSFQWFADPDGNPSTSDDVPVVVSNSWGISPIWHGVPECDDEFWVAIDNCEAAGCAVVFAAGNEGSGSRSLRTPADRNTTSTNVFSVGALLAGSNSIAGFSSRGPSGCDGTTIKPEVTARGDNVRSAINGGGYGTLSGTSMACPHVAGAIALLRHGAPSATIEELKEALLNSAFDLGSAGEDNTYGTGRIDLVAALDYLGGSTGSVSIELSTDSNPIVLPGAGGTFEFDWTLSNTTDERVVVDAWLDGSHESGATQLVGGPFRVPLLAQSTREGSASYPLPGAYPDGEYTIEGKIGDYPNDVTDSDSFGILKGDVGDRTLNFDDLTDGAMVGSSYDNVTFSSGWTVWYSVGNPYYPPNSTPHVAYTHETANSITFNPPASNLEIYASAYDGYGDDYFYTVYDARGGQLQQLQTKGGVNQQLRFKASGISKLVVTGSGSWNTHHTVDDLTFSQ